LHHLDFDGHSAKGSALNFSAGQVVGTVIMTAAIEAHNVKFLDPKGRRRSIDSSLPLASREAFQDL
jgi:hypothetical protein